MIVQQKTSLLTLRLRVALALKADVRSRLNGLHDDVSSNDKLILRVCLLHPV